MENVVDLRDRPKRLPKAKTRATASAEDARFTLQEAARSLCQLEALLWLIAKHATEETGAACEASRARIAMAVGACQEIAHRTGTHAAVSHGVLFGKEAAARIFEPFL